MMLNLAHALDAAGVACLHFGGHCRRASDARRYLFPITAVTTVLRSGQSEKGKT
jgi:hypothetical protein